MYAPRNSLTMLLAVVGWAIYACSTASAAEGVTPNVRESLFHTRSYNPFTQIFGRPEFFAGATLPGRSWNARLTTNIVSHTEPSSRQGFEQLELDGETYNLAVTVDYGVNDRWEIGARAPLIHHSGGFMDGIVENWHDVIGASNAQRDVRPRNQLEFSYQRDGFEYSNLTDSNTGLADISFHTRYQLLSNAPDTRKLALHASIKLPTGDEDQLQGSGATDYTLGIGFTDPVTLAGANMTVSANAGVLFLGSSDVLGELQKDTVAFGGLQLGIAIGRRFDLIGQVQATSAYYHSRLHTLGDATVQLSIGANIRFPDSGWQWMFGIVEDAFSDMTPDFALHMEITKAFGR